MKVQVKIAGYTPFTWLCLGLMSYSAWSFKNQVLDSNLVQKAGQRATAMHLADHTDY
ncbi:MAG: hypothetical protein AB8C84_07695 [Oligoflexales bacterium]